MNFNFWAFEGGFYLGLPLRPSGYVILGFSIAVLLVMAFFSRPKRRSKRRQDSIFHWGLLALLLLSSALLSGLVWIELPGLSSPIVPGIPLEKSAPVISFFGALPWMLAAGFLGPLEAILVGLATGLARGGWDTNSLITPVLLALEGGVVAWLLRRDFDDIFGVLSRNPVFSGVVGGLFYGVLASFERYAYSGGSTYDGLDYALTLLGPTLLTAAVEAGLAGLMAMGLQRLAPHRWQTPVQLRVGPYRRSLTARFVSVYVVLGLLASGVLFLGDWFLAHSSARELVETSMRQSATQAGEDIPYFILTGRSQSRQLAAEFAPLMAEGSVSSEMLASDLLLAPFFTRLAVFDANGQLFAIAPQGGGASTTSNLELDAAVGLALQGIPQEIILTSSGLEMPQVGFVSPIMDLQTSQALGVLVGWTDLESNPMLMPVSRRLLQAAPGESFVVDDKGTVLLHPEDTPPTLTVDLENAPFGQVFTDTAADGTRRFVFAYSVPGYPWSVIITTPQRVVNSLAVPIAVRLFVVVAIVGTALLLAVYASTRRLTKPLRQMASVAESIARGNLARPVRRSGEDEIGRLSMSFERMRHSLRDRLSEMDLLLTVSQDLASSFRLKQVLPPILTGLCDITKADLVRLVLMPPRGAEAEVMESYGVGIDPGSWHTLDVQVLDLCRQGGQFILENPHRARALLDLSQLEKPIEALMGIPIMDEEQFVGALWLGHQVPHAFSAYELNLLSIITSQLGVAIANARLYQLAEQERLRLSAILEATPEAVIVTDREGRLLLANPAAELVLRTTAQEALGQTVADVVSVAELAELLLEVGGDVQSTEVRLDDETVLFATARDINPVGEQPVGRVCVLWDITDFKKLDALKSEFVATVSHDLRAPLTMMRGYASVLSLMGEMSPQQKEYVGKILESIDQMSHLVDNVLDLGRLEGSGGLKLEAVDGGELVNQVVDSYRRQVANKQITVQVEIQESLAPMEADATLLRQAIANLVDNAIKFTQSQGQIVIKAYQEGGRQLISVQDSGSGIARADQVRLFEKFYRPASGEGLGDQGPGLGLSIVKSIAERHHGRITFESRLGEGSTFVLDIPLNQSQSEHEA